MSPMAPKKKFNFRQVGESDEALAAKKAKVQFAKNGLTVVQKTRVLSMSPSRTLMSMNREQSYGQLLRGSGNMTLPDVSLSGGSNQNSAASLNASPINFQMPTITQNLGGTSGTNATENRDLAGLDLTDDKMGLTFFTGGGSQSRQSDQSGFQLHNYNQFNLQFTANGASLSPPKPAITDHERENVGKGSLLLAGSSFAIKPHRFSNVNQEQFVARIQKTADDRMLIE